jgi:glutamate synthase (ferredoxin)
MLFIAREVRQLMAQLGFRTINEMVGRTDCLEMRSDIDHWKAHGLDLSQILFQPAVAESVGRYCQIEQDHGLSESLDQTTLMDVCAPALKGDGPVAASFPIRNTNRAVGAMLGSKVTRTWGAAGLPDDTIRLSFNGSAGQSFGAFIPRGLTLTLEGDANDYVGKGLSGGKIVVYPPRTATFKAEDNVIIGNVAFYGATGGEAYIRGIAGERFCVRNSGALAVVEGVGDHGCEYMTGGRVVVLGRTGRNFAAGMSGGIAYVFDEHKKFETRCNRAMVELTRIEDADEIEMIKNMIFRHCECTASSRATEILLGWDDLQTQFVRVIPHDYRRVLEAEKQMKHAGLTAAEAAIAAFELNARSLAHVTGA